MILVLAIALVARVAWASLVPVEPVSDSAAYDVFAQNLANANTYGWEEDKPDAYWPVGAPFVYSVLYRVYGHVYWPIVVFNVAVGLATVLAVMFLSRRLFGSDQLALLAGLALAVWPTQVQFSTVLASELPFALMVVIALGLVLRPEWSPLRLVAAGVALAAACYLRPVAILLPFVFGLFLWRQHGFVRAIAGGAIVLGCMALLVAPWTARNYHVFGRFIPVSANSGSNLWMGNNPESKGTYQPLPPEVKEMDTGTRDDHLKKKAVEYMLSHPGRTIALALRKLAITHSSETIGVVWNVAALNRVVGERGVWWLKLVSAGFWLLMLGCGVIGVFVVLRREGLAGIVHPAVILWAYFAAVHAVIVAQDRYHLPSVPFIAMLAAVALDAVARVASRKRAEPAPSVVTSHG